METHIVLQKTPSFVAEIDYTQVHLIKADSKDEAMEKLKEATEPSSEGRSKNGLRNDAGKAHNVQYVGTVDDLDQDVTRLSNLYEAVEADRVEDLPTRLSDE